MGDFFSTPRPRPRGPAIEDAGDAARIAAVETDRNAKRRRQKGDRDKAAATQRARFASRGLSARDGSAAALIDGLIAEADARIAEDDSRARDRKQQIRLNAEQRAKRERDLLAKEEQKRMDRLRRLF